MTHELIITKEKPHRHITACAGIQYEHQSPETGQELCIDIPRKDKTLQQRLFCRTSLTAYPRPRDFMYFFDLRSPILEAFFFTASVGRPSFAAIFAVGLLGKSFFSRLNSLFVHSPLMSFFFVFFFAIAYPFRLNWTNGSPHAL